MRATARAPHTSYLGCCCGGLCTRRGRAGEGDAVDARPDDGDGGAYGDIIADANAESPITVVERNALIDSVKFELDTLPERDREIVAMRFGIPDGRPRTLDEVAAEFGVTRERIRQIEQKTLARLRHPHNSARLRAFLDD